MYEIINGEDKSFLMKEGETIHESFDFVLKEVKSDLEYIANSGDFILFFQNHDVSVIRLYLKEAYSAGYKIMTHTTSEYGHSFTLEKKGN